MVIFPISRSQRPNSRYHGTTATAIYLSACPIHPEVPTLQIADCSHSNLITGYNSLDILKASMFLSFFSLTSHSRYNRRKQSRRDSTERACGLCVRVYCVCTVCVLCVCVYCVCVLCVCVLCVSVYCVCKCVCTVCVLCVYCVCKCVCTVCVLCVYCVCTVCVLCVRVYVCTVCTCVCVLHIQCMMYGSSGRVFWCVSVLEQCSHQFRTLCLSHIRLQMITSGLNILNSVF